MVRSTISIQISPPCHYTWYNSVSICFWVRPSSNTLDPPWSSDIFIFKNTLLSNNFNNWDFFTHIKELLLLLASTGWLEIKDYYAGEALQYKQCFLDLYISYICGIQHTKALLILSYLSSEPRGIKSLKPICSQNQHALIEHPKVFNLSFRN